MIERIVSGPSRSQRRKQGKPREAMLHWTDPEGRPRILSLERAETIVGRQGDCDLVIADVSISREHAKFLLSNGVYFLVDLASINGTFVNGQRVQAWRLRSGDSIQFAKSPVPVRFEQGAPTPKRVHRASDEVLPPERILGMVLAEMRKTIEQRWDLDRELRLAEEIQDGLLPQEFPAIEGYRVIAHSTPTRYVGGDFYDLIVPSPDRFLAVLGDISGKGVAASLLSSMVLGSLDAQFRSGTGLEEALSSLNLLLCEKGCGRFATLFLCQLDNGGRGRFVSAGHNPAYIYRRETGEVVEVTSNSPIAGGFRDSTFESGSIGLGAGDLLLVYTDGLTDAQNAEGKMLGEDPVIRVLRQTSPGGAEHVRAALLELVGEFSAGQDQIDDITFVVIERS